MRGCYGRSKILEKFSFIQRSWENNWSGRSPIVVSSMLCWLNKLTILHRKISEKWRQVHTGRDISDVNFCCLEASDWWRTMASAKCKRLPVKGRQGCLGKVRKRFFISKEYIFMGPGGINAFFLLYLVGIEWGKWYPGAQEENVQL